MFHFLSFLSMYFIVTCLNVLTTPVFVCYAELKGYLLSCLLISLLAYLDTLVAVNFGIAPEQVKVFLWKYT